MEGSGGHGPLVHLSYSTVTVVQPRFVNGGKARERGEGVGGGFPRKGGFSKFVYEFSCTLDTIIRGSLCTGIDQFLSLFLFSFFS